MFKEKDGQLYLPLSDSESESFEDHSYDIPDIYDPKAFEDVSVPLVRGITFTSSNQISGISSDDTNLYLLIFGQIRIYSFAGVQQSGTRTLSGTPIRTYSVITGDFDSQGNRIFRTVRREAILTRLAMTNNRFFIGASWALQRTDGDPYTENKLLEYSRNGTFIQEHDTSFLPYDATNDYLILGNRVYNPSVDIQTNTVDLTTSIGTPPSGARAINDNRVFALSGTTNLQAYSYTGSSSSFSTTRVSDDDTTILSSIDHDRIHDMCGANNDIYVAYRTTINTHHVIAYNVNPYRATWSEEQYSGGQLSARIRFTHSVTGVSDSDFTIVNSSGAEQGGWSFDTIPSSLTTNGTTIRANPPSTTNGRFSIRINANSIQFDGSNNGPRFNTNSALVHVNNTAAVGVTSFTAPANPQGNRYVARLILDRAVPQSELMGTDFTVPAGTHVGVTNISGTTPETTFDISIINPPNSMGSYNLTLNANAIPAATTYLSGPPRAVSIPITYDSRLLIVQIRLSSFCGRSNRLTTVISFNPAIINNSLTASDLSVLNNSDPAVTQTGWSHTISEITPQSYNITSIAPDNTNGIFKFRLGREFIQFGSPQRLGPTSDIDGPEFNLDNRLQGGEEVAMFWSNLTGGTSLSGRLTVTGQSISGLATSDFEVIFSSSGSMESNFTISLDPSGATVNAGSYVMVTATRSGFLRTETNYRLRLKEDSVTANSMDAPSTNIDSNDIYFNNYTVWGTASYSRADNELSAVMTFGTTIRGLAVSDFDVIDQTDTTQSGWTIEFDPTGTTTRVLNQTLTVKATAPSNISGIFRLRLKEDTIRTGAASTDNHPTQDVITNSVLVNNIESAPAPEEPVAEAFWSNLTGGTNLTGRINFVGKDVSNISASDFEAIFASSGAREPQFTISLNPTGTTATAGSYITVTAARTSQLRTEANYKLRLKEDSIRSTGSTSDDTPSVNIDSNPIYFNSYTVWGAASYSKADNELSAVLTFGALIRGITTADFDVLDQTDTAQSGWTITIDPSGTTTRTFGQTLTVKATAPANVSDTFRIRLKERTLRTGAAQSDNHPTQDVVTNAVLVNNIAVTPVTVDRSEAFWSNLQGGTSLSGDITFPGADITGLAPEDFEVALFVTGIREPRFTITISSTSADQGQTITVTAAPSLALAHDTDYQFRLKQESARSGGATENNFPVADINSNSIYFNTLMFWGDSEGGTSISCPLAFRTDVDGIDTDNFEVIDQTDVVQDTWTISFNPDGTTSRDSGESLTVTGTPPTDELVSDIYRLRLKANTMDFATQTNNIPNRSITSPASRVNNLETDLTLEAPYLIATVPASTASTADPFTTLQTPANNPNRVITLTITSYVERSETNISNLRATDFVITSDAGRLTATLT